MTTAPPATPPIRTSPGWGCGSWSWRRSSGDCSTGRWSARFAPEARGHGVPEVMLAVAEHGGRIRPQVPTVKALASALCIGSGGSVGREGPIVQIGSALGSLHGPGRPPVARAGCALLVACGAAGGISATFNAPIAGVFFALEVILRDFETAVLRGRRPQLGHRGRASAAPRSDRRASSPPRVQLVSPARVRALRAARCARGGRRRRRSSACSTAARTSPTVSGVGRRGRDPRSAGRARPVAARAAADVRSGLSGPLPRGRGPLRDRRSCSCCSSASSWPRA